MVVMPVPFSSAAAASASSAFSPGMNRVTDFLTNPHLVTWSRSHALVDAASSAFLITLIDGEPVPRRFVAPAAPTLVRPLG